MILQHPREVYESFMASLIASDLNAKIAERMFLMLLAAAIIWSCRGASQTVLHNDKEVKLHFGGSTDGCTLFMPQGQSRLLMKLSTSISGNFI